MRWDLYLWTLICSLCRHATGQISVCPSGWYHIEKYNKCTKVNEKELAWSYASDACRNLRANLLTVRSKEEWEDIQANKTGYWSWDPEDRFDMYYIGLRGFPNDLDTMFWEDGSKLEWDFKAKIYNFRKGFKQCFKLTVELSDVYLFRAECYIEAKSICEIINPCAGCNHTCGYDDDGKRYCKCFYGFTYHGGHCLEDVEPGKEEDTSNILYYMAVPAGIALLGALMCLLKSLKNDKENGKPVGDKPSREMQGGDTALDKNSEHARASNDFTSGQSSSSRLTTEKGTGSSNGETQEKVDGAPLQTNYVSIQNGDTSIQKDKTSILEDRGFIQNYDASQIALEDEGKGAQDASKDTDDYKNDEPSAP